MSTFMTELFRYGVVGVTVNLVGYLVFLAIVALGLDPKTAMSMLYICGATAGFLLNRSWTFRVQGSLWGPGLRYILAHVAGYVLNLLLLLVLVDGLGYPHQIVQLGAVFVVAAFLFVVFRLIVFPASRAPR